ncbi:MAG TPA: hypothetical protein VHD61_05330 [Lacunisphaera sp.]|nr:hypothetical protein [Lacunisphaera sp.]
MTASNPVLSRQLTTIRKIFADETWLEGERRGCFVPPDDPVVREKVCGVILRIGRELRENIEAQAAAEVGLPDAPHRDEAA